ncbi:MAG: cytochrome c biogenesis protein CcsA [Gammaproteobacteria bacterium]
MTPAVLSLAAIVLYLVATASLVVGVRAETRIASGLHIITTAAAVLIHGFVLHHSLVSPAGFNVGIFNTASLVGWLVAVLALMVNIGKPMHALLIGLLPLSALSLALEWIFGGSHVVTAQMPRGVDLHIALSLVAYSILTIAAFQAILIAMADRQLRNKRPLRIMRALPPLASMETLLFQLLTVGTVLLGVGLISGFLFVQNLLAQHLVHKTVLSLLAWAVFAVLLWGRYQRGWRGRTAVNYTLAGFTLLAVGFFGSEAVLQLILNRI